MKTENTAIESKPKEVVLSLINAINSEDFKTARTFVTPDMKFSGVLGSRDGADAYFKDMEQMKLKYDVKKIFADDNDASVFYDLQMGGQKVFCSAWYHLKDGKVSSLKVVFDPRPVLDDRSKKN
ncbi:MAG TPA: nuclear transport factor 2 family protein [Bacteroidia bacterium]|nr:nuclear transport factor 2 family protein [Bacteroidia bacterium]